jgi:hypothetical protein
MQGIESPELSLGDTCNLSDGKAIVKMMHIAFQKPRGYKEHLYTASTQIGRLEETKMPAKDAEDADDLQARDAVKPGAMAANVTCVGRFLGRSCAATILG